MCQVIASQSGGANFEPAADVRNSTTIAKAVATVALSGLTQTYTGAALTPTAATTPLGLSVALTGAPQTAAGSYPVTAAVTDPNYQGSANETFVINKAAATV